MLYNHKLYTIHSTFVISKSSLDSSRDYHVTSRRRWKCEPWTYHIEANFSSILPRYKDTKGRAFLGIPYGDLVVVVAGCMFTGKSINAHRYGVYYIYIYVMYVLIM